MSGLMLSEINHFVAAEEVIQELNEFVQVYACQDGNVYISPLWDAVLRDNLAATQLETDVLADEDRREQAGELDTGDTQVQDILLSTQVWKDKSPVVREFLRAVAPYDPLTGVCATCGTEITGFRDDLSRREYCISGMCQKCQDRVFGVEDTLAEGRRILRGDDEDWEGMI